MGNQARVELLCCGCEFYPLISCLLELKYSEQLLEESNAFWNMLMDEIISQGKRSRERISIWSFYLISRVDVHTWVDSWTAESQIKTWKCDILTLIIYWIFLKIGKKSGYLTPIEAWNLPVCSVNFRTFLIFFDDCVCLNQRLLQPKDRGPKPHWSGAGAVSNFWPIFK